MASLPSSPDDAGEDEKDMVKGRDQAQVDLLLVGQICYCYGGVYLTTVDNTQFKEGAVGALNSAVEVVMETTIDW